MRRILFILLCLTAFSLQARTKHKSHSKKKSAHAAVVKSAGHKKAAVRKVSRKVSPNVTKTVATRSNSKQPVKPATTWRTRQQSPSPDRYREIQEALAAKGYLKSDPNGVWDQESGAALRRFQEEQNLEPSGRVNSISLIALGLGPRTDASARPPAVP